jgi:hypothetical protein
MEQIQVGIAVSHWKSRSIAWFWVWPDLCCFQLFELMLSVINAIVGDVITVGARANNDSMKNGLKLAQRYMDKGKD